MNKNKFLFILYSFQQYKFKIKIIKNEKNNINLLIIRFDKLFLSN
jgi:hypothetical protein